jgi:4-oxalomesaconate tautomerase
VPQGHRGAGGGFGGNGVPAPGDPAARLAVVPEGAGKALSIGHPVGAFTVIATVEGDVVTGAAMLRTARALMDGVVCQVGHDGG